MNNRNGQFGYQPRGVKEKGYQPTRPGNGYQPTTSESSQLSLPPSGGSAVQDKDK